MHLPLSPVKPSPDFIADHVLGLPKETERFRSIGCESVLSVKKYVEFFLAFLIAIDLVALILKLTHLFGTGGAYEKAAAALRATDLVEVHRMPYPVMRCSAKIPPNIPVPPVIKTVPFGSSPAGGVNTILPVCSPWLMSRKACRA